MFDESSPERLLEEASQATEAGELDRARKLFNQALRSAEEAHDPELLREVELSYANWLADQEDTVEACRYVRRAYSSAQEWQDQPMQARAASLYGWLEHVQEHEARALDLLDEARSLFTSIGDSSGLAGVLSNLALVYSDLERTDEALACYREMAEHFESQGDADSLARTTANISGLLRAEGDFDAALAGFEDALEAFELLEQSSDVAITLGNMAGVYRARGEVETALDYYDRALKRFEEADDVLGQAYTVGNIADIKRAQGRYEEALKDYGEVRRRFEELEQPSNAAVATAKSADTLHARGDDADALQRYEEALKLFEEANDLTSKAVVMSSVGNVLRTLGREEEAVQHFEEAREIFTLLGDESNLGVVIGNLANLARDHGEVDEARRLYEEAREIFGRFQDTLNQVLTLRNIAEMYERAGEHDEADTTFNEALLLCETKLRDEPRILGETSFLFAEMLNQRGESVRALPHLHAARKHYKASDDGLALLEVLMTLGHTYQNAEQLDRALQTFEEALGVIEPLQLLAEEGVIYNAMALVHRERGETDEARRRIEQAIEAFEKSGDEAGHAQALINLGALQHALENWEESQTAFTRAIEISRSLKDHFAEGRTWVALASMQRERGAVDEAADALESARDAFAANGDTFGEV